MDFSSFFLNDPSFSFLNAGTLSRTPIEVLEFIEAESRERERNPTKTVFEGAGRSWKVMEQLASFLGADPNDLFLRSNITAALNDFLFGLEFKGKGEFVVTDMEYGATANLAKVRAGQLGFGFRSIPLPSGPDVTSENLRDAILAGIGPDTKLLVISHVVTSTGTILPIEEIGAEAKSRGIITVVDGAHGVGALDLQLGALDVDFYGGNFHKWFMGPRGTAFGWVHPRLRAKVDWKFGGWASFSSPDHYQGFGGNQEAAIRLFQGTMNVVPFEALSLVLRFWRAHGPEHIRGRQRVLRDLCGSLLEKEGWVRLSPRDPGLLGPLVSFRLTESWASTQAGNLASRLLLEAGVQVALPISQGKRVLRLSPGAYSTEQEVEEGIERILRFGKSL